MMTLLQVFVFFFFEQINNPVFELAPETSQVFPAVHLRFAHHIFHHYRHFFSCLLLQCFGHGDIRKIFFKLFAVMFIIVVAFQD